MKQDLSKKQKKRLLSSTSIHEVHTLLKTAFSYAVEWDLIHKDVYKRQAEDFSEITDAEAQQLGFPF